MRRWFFFINLALCLCFSQTKAQQSLIDSLEKEIAISSDTTRVKLSINLANLYWSLPNRAKRENFATAQKIAERALSESRALKYKKGEADALSEIASLLIFAYKYQGSFNASLDSSRKALEIYRQYGDSASAMKCLYGVAMCLHMLGDLPQSMNYFDSVENYYLKKRDTVASIYAVAMLGHSYFDLGDYRSAYDLGTKAEKIATRFSDTAGQVYAFTHMANLYVGADLPELALPYLHRVLAVNPYKIVQPGELVDPSLVWALSMGGEAYMKLGELDSADWISRAIPDDSLDFYSLQFYGKLYESKNDFSRAMPYFRNALRQSFKLGHAIGIAQEAINLGNSYFHLKERDSALKYALMAMERSNQIHALLEQKKAASLLMDIYAADKNFAKAFYYSQLFKALTDSVAPEQYKRKLFLVQVQDQLAQEKQQSLLLDQENKIKEQQLSRGKILRNSLIVAVLLLASIGVIIIRNNRQRRIANVMLREEKGKVENTLRELKATQAQLIQSEKLASLGELTAGIAHEIQNPLNFVNNFSDVNKELIAELRTEAEKGNVADVKLLANDLEQNLEKISTHGKRADSIVKSMMEHSRKTPGEKELTDINAICSEYLRLGWNGFKTKEKIVDVEVKTDLDPTIPAVKIIPNEFGRVILNLLNNAFYAVSEKSRLNGDGYRPVVSLTTEKLINLIQVRVSDNGDGISEQIKSKIFQPFFTTKPTGQGTGLGLSLSYDIIKAHGGEIKVETKEGEYAEFIIRLPA